MKRASEAYVIMWIIYGLICGISANILQYMTVYEIDYIAGMDCTSMGQLAITSGMLSIYSAMHFVLLHFIQEKERKKKMVEE